MKSKSSRIALFTSVLLLAAFARFVALDTLPPGWRDDELIEVDMDIRVAAGWRPLYIEEAEGHESLYHYVHALTVALFGPGRLSYRWLGAVCGLLAAALTMRLGGWLFGWQVGLFAGAAMAVSFWPLMYSRLGLRHIGILPPLLIAISNLDPARKYAKFQISDWRLEIGDWRLEFEILNLKSIICGVALAAGLYIYFAGRAVPLILLGFAAYLALFHCRLFKQQWIGLLMTAGVALLLFAPLGVYLAGRPIEARLEIVGRPLTEVRKGNLVPAIETTLGTLGMFTFRGDPEWLYNLSGRPVFDWVTGAFFYLGLALAVWRWRRVEYGLLLIWLLGGLAPAMLSLPAASFGHTMAALPAVYLALGLGLAEVANLVVGGDSARKVIRLVVIVGTLGLHSLLSWRAYALSWSQHRYVRFLYHADVADVARYLREHPEIQDVAISTTAEELKLDAHGLKLDLPRSKARPRLFDPRHALVLPGGQETWVATISDPLPAPHIQDLLLKQAALVGAGPPTVNGPAFRLYTARQITPATSQAVSLPVTFGGQLSLVELEVENLPGLRVRTTWRVEEGAALLPTLKLFAHLLAPDGSPLAAGDRLDVWPPALRPGDQFVQWNDLALPPDAVPGEYYVAVGLYEPDGARWQITGTDQDYVRVKLEIGD